MTTTLAERWGAFKQATGFLLTGQGAQSGTLLASLLGRGPAPKRARDEYLRGYSELPWLHAVVNRVAFDVAAVPWRLYVKQGDKLRELQGDHPMRTLLTQGVPGILSGFDTLRLTQSWLDLVGDALWLLERNGVGAPTEALPLPPNWIQRVPTVKTPWFELRLPDGFRARVPMQEVVWFKNVDPANPYVRGTSTAVALGDEFTTDELAAKYVGQFFHNYARPDLIVYADQLNKETTRRLEEEWNAKSQGVWNRFRTFFLNKKVEIKEISQNLQHLQFVELRQFERDMIIQTYGMPPEILGILVNSNRATIDAADYFYAKRLLVPRLTLMDLVLTMRLAKEYDERLVLQHDNPVPEDRVFRLEQTSRGAQIGTINVDEWRQSNQFDVIPNGGGKVFYLPATVIPVRTPAAEAVDDEEEPEEPEEDTLRAVPGKQFTPGRDLPSIKQLTQLMFRRVKPVYRSTILESGKAAMQQVGVDQPFRIVTPAVARFIEHQAFRRIDDVSRVTRGKLVAALEEGLAAGESTAKLADRVSAVYAEWKGPRARVIARTEGLSAVNFGTLEGYRQSEVVERKEWLTSRDDKVRESHADLEGETVALTDAFSNGLDYPGDPSGPPEETVNCRCTISPVLGKSLLVTEPQRVAWWQDQNLKAQRNERVFFRAIVRSLQDQQNAIMTIVRG